MHSHWSIPPLSREREPAIRHHIDQKTKPLGALGQLESLALQLALIQGGEQLKITQPTMLVFAADHGIAEAGISIAPSAVTRQMVLNFLAGGAAINCFCQANDMRLKVVDAGILEPIDDPRLIQQRLGAGTRNLAQEPAMSHEQVEQGLALGAALARAQVEEGCNLLAFGEMGIGNTTPAACILAALSKQPVEVCVGRGTGINEEQYRRKLALVRQALTRVGDNRDPLQLLREVGGFEIAQITGAILGAAQAGIPVLLDGFIVTSAAMLAVSLAPACRDYLIFSHVSDESGHRLMLTWLEAEPLLQLGLRLGEGSGAALALPLLRAAVAFYNDMASFDSAGVTV